MSMARTKKVTTEPLRVRTIKVTPAAEGILQRLGQDASDALGWTVSGSAVIRALVRHAGGQAPAWAAEVLHPLIEEEIGQGRVWGKVKR